ncbi:phosphonate ABC transporter substrate-binding protein [Xanthobacter agilis]|uniref:Phosphonate transport system substrate-binding protein n=1 Tax=Xanthobacter agilis TaxID=47492 RepID=A0ABU0L9R7_XANAG|nr:phosphonate ABC transporter substrate-binding protein [Xanthobacter agilis]MDQ0503885.1 phosphonate transport system substrate-binding protein [Xanthobacter agilis]
MLNRRTLIAAAAALAFSAGAAAAQDYKAKYPELTFAFIPAENATGVTERYAPLMAYLTKELGVPVTLRIANDYAAVIEGQRAGNIQLAYYGPAAFARALKTGAPVEAFAIEVNADGTKGYHSVLYVKKDSPYKTVEDLKGKNICLVDPNSTSGNNVPRYALSKMGIKPDEYFGKVVYAGSHENAVLGVQQGTCDAAFNWWNDDQESALRRMERKGMAKYDDYRIIYKSDLIVNSPYAYLATLPADLKAKIRDAFFSIEKNDKAAFDKIYEGKSQMWQPVDNEAYTPVVELITFVDNLRKQKN